VVSDCLQPITSCARKKLSSTVTPGGMIQNMSQATLEWSAYFECISSCWHHQAVMSSIQNVMWIIIGYEGKSLTFRLILPEFFCASGAKFNHTMLAVNKRIEQSLRLGVIWPKFFGVIHYSSSLSRIYGLKDDWPDPEAVAEGMRLLLGMSSSLLSCTLQGITQY